MSNKFTHPHVILDGKWRMIDEDPAGPYFQEPLKHAMNCLSVDERKAAKVVVANVSI